MYADLVSAPFTGNHTVFLSGPPGCGKTTLAVRRLGYFLEKGIPAEQILVLVPQRTLATPYYQALRRAESPAGGIVDVATIGGLARRTLDLFWPLVAQPASFADPGRPPRFLTLETAQYYMDRIVEPFIASGGFDGITIPRTRLVSQIIDNLNKAAAIGFPLAEIAVRLKSAWSGESAQLRILDQVQSVALAFRRACLAENLLDWSLQIEVFWRYLLPLPQLRRYLLSGYRHLIVDNSEEDIPVTHDLLRTWLPLAESALVIHDTDGGYRVFLGADPQGALSLANLCRERALLTESHVTTPEMVALGAKLAAPFTSLSQAQGPEAGKITGTMEEPIDPRAAIHIQGQPFHPQMLDWVAEEVSRLVLEDNLVPGQIAILAPFLSDALRFSLAERLQRYHIPVRTHRPSRELSEEPAARCLLTLAKLAHPAWRRPPPAADVAQALMLSIADLDPVRARLLTDIVYRVKDGQGTLTPFHQIVPEMQDRISYLLGGRYDELRQWIQGYVERAKEVHGAEGLDYFLSRLFGEVLSQSGFGFHSDFDAGAVAANLIESIQKFRQTFPPPPLTPALSPLGRGSELPSVSAAPPRPPEGERLGVSAVPPRPPEGEGPGVRVDLSLEYVDLVERGVVAAQYVSSWQSRPENAVLLVPAYTFLMMNQAVMVQFWLDAGSRAWFERIYQPLTHPYVLRRDWPEGQVWADEDEVRVREQALGRLILGLTRRCRQRIYLAYSERNERGYEERGPVLQAVQRLLRGWEGAGDE